MKLDLARMYPQERVAVIGNLPYHISKELIDWLIAQRDRIGAAVLMLQKDFVDKLLARGGGKNYHRPVGGLPAAVPDPARLPRFGRRLRPQAEGRLDGDRRPAARSRLPMSRRSTTS